MDNRQEKSRHFPISRILPFMDDNGCTPPSLEYRTFHLSRPCPISAIIYQTYDSPEKEGHLLFVLRTPLEYSLIRETFSHSDFNLTKQFFSPEYHGTFIWRFNLSQNKIWDIEKLFKDIFHQLAQLTPQMKDKFSEIDNELNLALKRFFMNRIRYQSSSDSYHITDTSGAKELFEFITESNVEKVYELLSNKTCPNSYYENVTALTFAIASGIAAYYINNFDLNKRLSIIALLLEYGANPMLESYGMTAFEKTANESIFESVYRFSKINVEYFNEIMKVLTAADTFYPHISINKETEKTKIGKVVHGANMFFKNVTHHSHSYPKTMNVIYRDDSFHFYMTGYVKISVKSLSGYDLAQDESEIIREQLYQLFKSTFDWEKYSQRFKNDETKFRKYFNKLLPKINGLVDCIYYQDELVGMNIVEVTEKKYGDENIIIHYLKLGVANEFLRQCKRLMSIIANARGFALQKNNPNATVISYFEAASVSSFLQVCHLDMYPKIKTLEDKLNKIAQDFYPSKIETHKGLHIRDKLAFAKTFSLPGKFFWSENELAMNGFEKRYQVDGQSIISGFINNDTNLQKLSRKIDPHCSGITFNKIVAYYAEIVKTPQLLTSSKSKL